MQYIRKKKFLIIIIIVALVAFNYKTNTTINVFNQNNLKNSTNNSTNKEFLDYYRNHYNNHFIIGNLKISPNIDTLIVQGKDNIFYLTHDLYQNYSKSGSVFIDYRLPINSKKIIVYGHNTNSDVPFKHLLNYLDEKYYNDHKEILLYLDNSTIKYEIFSVYITLDNYEHMKVNLPDTIWQNHLTTLSNLSIYRTEKTFSDDDEIIILQTCLERSSKKLLIICGRKER